MTRYHPIQKVVSLLLGTAVIAATTTTVSLSEARAQQIVAPDEVNRTQTQTDLPSDTIDQTGADEDDDEPEPGESAFDSFDDLEIERVNPDEIPDFQPGLPDGAPSRMDTDDLPRNLSGSQLEQVTEHVSAATVELIAIQRPPRPYRSTDMLYRGHALWISGSDTGEDPILVATHDWLEEAEEIYAIDGKVSRGLSEGGLETGSTQSQPLDDFSGDPTELLDRNRANLVRLDVDDANRHFNLAMLGPVDDEELTTPTYGMVIHPMESPMPNAIFGYSPSVAAAVTPTGYVDSDELEIEYSFYYLVAFQAILGAPIVGPTGRLIGISALRYPEEPAKSLTIPPGAIHNFVDRHWPGDDDDE